jgi:SH3 domain protein
MATLSAPKKLLLAIILSALTGLAGAETLYVIDKLVITLRAGPTAQDRILKTLGSGAKLEVLETGSTYTRVRTEDGTEGWVPNQYVGKEPSARQRLAEAENKVSALSAENTRLKGELDTLGSRSTSVESTYQKVAAEHKTLTEELERLRRVSAHPLKLEEENQQMKKELVELENDYELLRQEHQLLTDSNEREWFITGAGAVLLGVLIGLIGPRLRGRKRSSW